ncbi:TetR/AcrR family transcriptional regulator [Desertimonas flava]|uniref:TetR/AcrR family transcriptional regulator n=1 Tax=Desertimonas flava TaxID=2064846 RepID=UPI000E354167|nr:TetR/AcrR family transcriptional regulator [Desertimonas flava]
MTTARERLLAKVVDHLAANGVADASLREIAAAVGTSHRMLLHHFGSREGLLAEVVRAVEASQRAALAEVFAGADAGGPVDARQLSARYWDTLVEVAQRFGVLFFELSAHAAVGRAYATTLREDLVDGWLPGVTELLGRLGVKPDDAPAAARLAVAASRGLLLDVLVTGDRQAVDEAARLFDRLLFSLT